MSNAIIIKKTVQVEFEDKGQGFLIWDIEWFEKEGLGVVVKCEPFQSEFWVGTKILNYPELGNKLIFKSLDLEQSPLTLKYKIIYVEILGVDYE